MSQSKRTHSFLHGAITWIPVITPLRVSFASEIACMLPPPERRLETTVSSMVDSQSRHSANANPLPDTLNQQLWIIADQKCPSLVCHRMGLVFPLPLNRCCIKGIYKMVQNDHPVKRMNFTTSLEMDLRTKGSHLRFLFPLIILSYFTDFFLKLSVNISVSWKIHILFSKSAFQPTRCKNGLGCACASVLLSLQANGKKSKETKWKWEVWSPHPSYHSANLPASRWQLEFYNY